MLEDGTNMTPKLRLERIATLPLGERPPLVVCLNAPKPHILVLWGSQVVTLSFTHPTPEDGKVPAFVRDIIFCLMPATVLVHPEWLSLGEVAVPQSADMEALVVRLAPGHPHLTLDTPRTDRVSVP